ncbi:MAG: hypothetical protein IBX44_02475 [Sulfurospirillum sp.]|nr:hypothetical protein [Sulfurospirillum sp.]
MELTPIFRVEVNSSDVTDVLQKNMISLEVSDEEGVLSDEVTLKVAGAYTRPLYGDELKLWLGYEESGLEFLGTYKVQTTSRKNREVLSIKATAVDFGGELKRKKTRDFKDMSYKALCEQIAREHSLDVLCDFDADFSYFAQHDESDLAFLMRLAKDVNQIFSIKNNTLFFGAKKQEKLSYGVDYDDCISLDITHSNKTKYGSVKATWRDTKSNTDKEVSYGDENPTLEIQGSFKDENEALLKAKARLERANKGTITGSLEMMGRVMFAGGTLHVSGSYDDGIYGIMRVSHRFDGGGFTTTVEFEN